jgi:O-antigen ligase/polysaccharide polymerase Wzy-like membrane protein
VILQQKDIIALTVLPVALVLTTTVMCLSRRARAFAFFLLAFGLVLATRYDVNFLSHEWYRGTTRGIEISFVDLLSFGIVFSSIFFPLPGQRRFYWPASLGFILLYMAYAAFSILISEPKIFGVFELSKMFRALMCFLAGALYVRSEREMRLLILALTVAVIYEGASAIYQRYGYGTYRVTGSLNHPNSLSIYLLMTAPIMVAAFNTKMPLWLRLGCLCAICCAGIGVVLTASRAAIPAFGIVMLGATLACISWKITIRKVAVTTFIVLAVGGVLIKSWDIVMARYEEATLGQEYDEDNKDNRGRYLRLAYAIVSDKFLGVGLNNWSYWVSKKYAHQIGVNEYEDYDDIPESLLTSTVEFDWAGKYAAPAHNLGAITVGELGIPGLFLFALLGLRWFTMGASFIFPRVPDPLRRIPIGIFFGLCGVFLQSLTEWVFRQTQVMLTVYLLMGVLASMYYLRKQQRKIEKAEPKWEYVPRRRSLLEPARVRGG